MAHVVEIEIYTERDEHGKPRQRFREIRSLPHISGFRAEDMCSRGTKIPGWATRVFEPSFIDQQSGDLTPGTYILKT